MTFFFLVVGLEAKRELDTGELRERRRIAIPVVAEFELFDECMYTIGVTERGSAYGPFAYFFGPGGRARRPALVMDIRGVGPPKYQFLAFPGEEPPEHRMQRGRRTGVHRPVTRSSRRTALPRGERSS